MSHQCKRFKESGSMKMFVGNYSISVAGVVKGGSISSDRLEVYCIECGQREWVDRAQIEKKGPYLVRKTA